MPELPDLQVFSRNLHEKISGKTVKTVTVHRAKKLNVTEKELQQALQDQKVKEVRRDGKELVIKFPNGNSLYLHLMLNGSMHLFENKHDQKYAILELRFTDGWGLLMADPRGMAKPTLNPPPADGIDPLSKDLDATFLKEVMKDKQASVKNFLLDQKVIRGIGNAYSDEILWEARISPFSICSKIPPKKVEDLVKSIKEVLVSAEQKITENYPDIISGEIRDFLLIHNPNKSESPNGYEIKVEKVGSRKTYYSEEQKLYK